MSRQLIEPTPATPERSASEAALFSALDALEANAKTYADGRARPEFEREVDAFERTRARALDGSPAARARLQGLQARLGMTTGRFPEIPLENKPLWLEGPDPYANFQSTETLPSTAGLVIIGAGITGSAALHLVLKHAERILLPVVRARLAGDDEATARAKLERAATSESATPGFRQILGRALEAALQKASSVLDRVTLAPGAASAREAWARRCLADALFDTASVVVLDAQDPCLGASGRNGGNRGMTENFEGTYQGTTEERIKLLMKQRGDDLSGDVLARAPREVVARAERETRLTDVAWMESRRIHNEILRETDAACDLKSGGWLKVAEDAAEAEALARDARRLEKTGVPVSLLTPQEIRDQSGFNVPAGGLKTLGETYHPVKSVRAVLKSGLERGGRLYTRTEVLGVDSTGPGEHHLRLSRGGQTCTLSSGLVLAATNAYTRTVFPEFDGIVPYRSQVAVFRHVPNALGETFYTRRQGDDYSNHPAPNLLIQGGGLDTPVGDDYRVPPVDAEVHELLVTYADEKIGPMPQLPVRHPDKRMYAPYSEWAGLMGFTPKHNKLPYAGALREGVFLSGGYNGYGNTFAPFCTQLVVEQALFGKKSEWSDLLDPRT